MSAILIYSALRGGGAFFPSLLLGCGTKVVDGGALLVYYLFSTPFFCLLVKYKPASCIGRAATWEKRIIFAFGAFPFFLMLGFFSLLRGRRCFL